VFILKTITKWYRISKDEAGNIKSINFNHYEEGHVDGDYPLPFSSEYSNQVAWKKEKWTKTFSYAKVGANHKGLYIKLLEEEK